MNNTSEITPKMVDYALTELSDVLCEKNIEHMNCRRKDSGLKWRIVVNAADAKKVERIIEDDGMPLFVAEIALGGGIYGVDPACD